VQQQDPVVSGGMREGESKSEAVAASAPTGGARATQCWAAQFNSV
jgi:hypothetical protein